MTPIVEYEGEQLEIDFALPQFSICPSCASQVIAIALWLWCLWLHLSQVKVVDHLSIT